MKKTQITITISILVIIAASVIYAQLGGTKDIEIKKINTNGYLLMGKKYEGKRSSKAFGKLMNEVADLVKTNQISGNFAVYHFINPDSEQDTLNSLIGIIVADSSQVTPNGFTFAKLASQEVLQATLKSHWLVSPNPAEIAQKLQAYASANKLTLVDTILEKYHQDKEIITEITIKSK